MYTFRIPAGGNAIFHALRELVGEPTTTERLSVGPWATRLDRFPCGCLRTYTARVRWGVTEAEESLDPCAQHLYLKALGGVFRGFAEPEAPQSPKGERQEVKVAVRTYDGRTWVDRYFPPAT